MKRIGASIATVSLVALGYVFAQEPPLAAPQSQPGSGSEIQQKELDIETRMRRRREQELRGEKTEQPATTTTTTTTRSTAEPARVSQSEWDAASGAIRERSPNIWERIERMPPDSPARANMMRSLLERHRDLQRIERRDPEQYKREVNQIELEDQILGVAREARRAESEEESIANRKKLRDLVTQLVDLRIKNREARLKRLTETLAAERDRLENDKRNREGAIERHFGTAMKGPPRSPRPRLPEGEPPTAPPAAVPQ